MLEPRSQKINGEATSQSHDTNQQKNLNEKQNGLPDGVPRSATKQQVARRLIGGTEKQQKVRIVLQESSEEHREPYRNSEHDSSVEFRKRKYHIIHKRSGSGAGNGTSHSRQRSRGRIMQNSVEFDNNHERSKSRRNGSFEKKRKFSSSNERKPGRSASDGGGKLKRVSKSARLSSETDSDLGSGSSSRSNAIVSIDHKSRGSYGRYFVKSRSRLRKQDTSPNDESRRMSKKKKRGGSASAKSTRNKNHRSKSLKVRKRISKKNRNERSSFSLKSRSKSRGRKKSNKSIDASYLTNKSSLSQKRHKKKSKYDKNRSYRKEQRYLIK